MVDTTSQINTLALSANDLRVLTDWPDALIEDYLTILRNLLSIAGVIDVDIAGEISSNEGRIGLAISNLARFGMQLSDLEHLDSSNLSFTQNFTNGLFSRPPKIGNLKPNEADFTLLGADTITVDNIIVNSNGTASLAVDINLADNVASTLLVRQGANNYIKIDTTNGAEKVEIGNFATDPDLTLLGSGTLGASNSGLGTAAASSMNISGSFGMAGVGAQSQQPNIPNPAGGATVDTEARTAIDSIISSLETFGFNAT